MSRGLRKVYNTPMVEMSIFVCRRPMGSYASVVIYEAHRYWTVSMIAFVEVEG